MEEQNLENEFSKEYSEEGFWDKVKKYAIKAGKDVIEKALTLYYCMLDKDTPKWAKGVISSALGYLIVIPDAIPDITPAVGYADDLGVLALAITTVGIHIKEKHIQMAKDKLSQWFAKNE